jgi:hypothetical protein
MRQIAPLEYINPLRPNRSETNDFFNRTSVYNWNDFVSPSLEQSFYCLKFSYRGQVGSESFLSVSLAIMTVNRKKCCATERGQQLLSLLVVEHNFLKSGSL